MNGRLVRFLEAENISQSQFADSIGVARASISHIIAGRNKPGFDFLEKMASCYPSLNIEWLITGKGRMYHDESENSSEYAILSENKSAQNSPTGRRISRVVVFYDDGTFGELK